MKKLTLKDVRENMAPDRLVIQLLDGMMESKPQTTWKLYRKGILLEILAGKANRIGLAAYQAEQGGLDGSEIMSTMLASELETPGDSSDVDFGTIVDEDGWRRAFEAFQRRQPEKELTHKQWETLNEWRDELIELQWQAGREDSAQL